MLPQPNSWDPQPPETREDYVMIGTAVGPLAEDAMPWEDSGTTHLVFKADPIRAEVALSTSCCYDPEVY